MLEENHGLINRILNNDLQSPLTESEINCIVKILKPNKILRESGLDIRLIAESMVVRIDEPGTIIIRQGDEGKECFFFLSGEVAIFIKTKKNENSSFAPTVQSGLFESKNNENESEQEDSVLSKAITTNFKVSDNNTMMPLSVGQLKLDAPHEKGEASFAESFLSPRRQSTLLTPVSSLGFNNMSGEDGSSFRHESPDVSAVDKPATARDKNDSLSQNAEASIEVSPTAKKISTRHTQEMYKEWGRLVSILKAGDSCGERSIQQESLTAATCITVSKVVSLTLTRSKFEGLIKAEVAKRNVEKEVFFKSCLPTGKDVPRLITRMICNSDVVQEIELPRGAKLLPYGTDQCGTLGLGGSFIVPLSASTNAEDPNKHHQGVLPHQVMQFAKQRKIFFLVEGAVSVRAPVRVGSVSAAAESKALRRIQKASSSQGAPADLDEVSIRSIDQWTTIARQERGGILGYASGLLGIREPFDLVIESKKAKFYWLRIHDLLIKMPTSVILWLLGVGTDTLQRHVDRQMARLDATQDVLRGQCMQTRDHGQMLWSSPFLRRKIQEAESVLQTTSTSASSGISAASIMGQVTSSMGKSNKGGDSFALNESSASAKMNASQTNDPNLLQTPPPHTESSRNMSSLSPNHLPNSSSQLHPSGSPENQLPPASGSVRSSSPPQSGRSISRRSSRKNNSISPKDLGLPTKQSLPLGGGPPECVDGITFRKEFLSRMNVQRNYFKNWAPPNDHSPAATLLAQNPSVSIASYTSPPRPPSSQISAQQQNAIFSELGISPPTSRTSQLLSSPWGLKNLPTSTAAFSSPSNFVKDSTSGMERIGLVSIAAPSATRTAGFVTSLLLPSGPAHAAIDARVIDSSHVITSKLPLSINGAPQQQMGIGGDNSNAVPVVTILSATNAPSASYVAALSKHQSSTTNPAKQTSSNHANNRLNTSRSTPSLPVMNSPQNHSSSSTALSKIRASPSSQANNNHSSSFSGLPADVRSKFDFSNGQVDPFLPPKSPGFGDQWQHALKLTGHFRGYGMLSPSAKKRVLLGEGRKVLKDERDKSIGVALLVAAGLSVNEVEAVVKVKDQLCLQEAQRLMNDPRVSSQKCLSVGNPLSRKATPMSGSLFKYDGSTTSSSTSPHA